MNFEKPDLGNGSSYSHSASRRFTCVPGQCLIGPHPSSTGHPAEFVAPTGCPDGEGIALGEGERADSAVAADGSAERAALLQLAVVQVQSAATAVRAQSSEGSVQIPGPAVSVPGLRLQAGPLSITTL